VENDRYDKLKQIKDEVLNDKNLPLYSYRIDNHYFPVIGQGNHYALIMFIAEAPGEEEAKTAKPFVGNAGKILDKLFLMAKIKREDVYITNIVKDRPPGNRVPTTEEIEAYSHFLIRQIEIIKPRIIVTLGKTSMEWIVSKYKLKNFGKISQVHGQIYQLKTKDQLIKYIPMFHPAMALYDPKKIGEMELDIKKIAKIYLDTQKNKQKC